VAASAKERGRSRHGRDDGSFEARQEELLELIHLKLKAGTHRFKPARRVRMAKEGSRSKKGWGFRSCW
jgi:hypothetical protein